MCLGEGDGAVDGDVDLLAAWHLDVLVQIREENIRGFQTRGSKTEAAHQAAITIYTGEDGLCSCGAGTNIRGAVGGRGSANAEDQTAGFDRGPGGVRRYELYQKPENGVRGRRGRSQFVVFAAVEKMVVNQAVQAEYRERGHRVRVHALGVAIFSARLRCHSVQDGAKLVTWVARILQFRRCQPRRRDERSRGALTWEGT